MEQVVGPSANHPVITVRSAVVFRDTLMTAPQRVMQLVRKFGAQREIDTIGVVTAARVRIEFIDPLFRALGWDVDNAKGLSFAHREVVRDGTVLVEGNRKAPDY